MILRVSTASLSSVCSSKHEAGRRSFWFEIHISLGLYKLLLFGSLQPEMSEKLRELQQGLKEEGADSFWRQVRKLGINALKALASELGMSVEGIRLKEEFASRVCAKIEVQESVARLCCVVQSGGTQGLWTQLKALKVQDIRVIAQELGLPTSGVRDALMKRLFDYISARDSGTTGAASPSSSSRRQVRLGLASPP